VKANRIEREVGEHFRKRSRRELFRAHPDRRDGDAEPGGRTGDDSCRRARADVGFDANDLGPTIPPRRPALFPGRDRTDDRILGFTMVGSEAGEVLAVVQTAMLAELPYTSFVTPPSRT